MKHWLAKVSRGGAVGLIPTDDESRTVIKRMKEGECVEVNFERSRSWQWHKMYKGICRSIAENQDPPRDPDEIDYEVRYYAGHYTTIWTKNGEQLQIPKRIAFNMLTADEWEALWPSLEQAIVTEYGGEYLGESQRTGTW